MLLLIVAILTAGFAWSETLSRAEQAVDPLERISAGLLCSISLWIGLNWILSLFHALTENGLYIGTVVLLGAALVGWWRLRPVRRTGAMRIGTLDGTLLVMLLLPLLGWTIYAAYVGSILPVVEDDALSYHFPKAVLMMHAHQYQFFPTVDMGISSLPCNYELLLADFLILQHTDQWTAWLSVFTWLFSTLACAALLQRWWGRGIHVACGAVFFAALPIALLQSYSHKNDMLLCSMFFLALLWGGQGGSCSLLLTLLALGIGVGTKPTILLVAGPLLALLAIRERSRFPRFLAWSLGSFLLLGGAVYLVNWWHTGNPFGTYRFYTSQHASSYGDWANLWQYPLLLALVPYNHDPHSVWVPWLHQSWWWPHYDYAFSDYGCGWAVLLLIFPLVVWRFRNLGPARERNLGSGLLLLALFVALPAHLNNFLANLVRYTLWSVPLVLGWSIVPLVAVLRQRYRLLAVLLVLAVAALAGVQEVDVARHDEEHPFRYVLQVSEHPGMRRPWGSIRSTMIVDALAGPHDIIAVDQGPMDCCLYPLWGKNLTRKVILLPPTGPVVIPPDVKWVVVDRAWSAQWGYDATVDTIRDPNYRPKPLPDDFRVAHALRDNPDFCPVFYDERVGSYVFVRKSQSR
ncbi:MAG: hypothetical protein ACYCW6_21080 [Candidatus Xenobia bacterium]